MSKSASIVNTIGVTLVALGSIFVAYEVVQRFKGERYQTTTQAVIDDKAMRPFGEPLFGKVVGISTTKAEDTVEYKSWERRRNIVMSIGLALILVGSGLQIWASWL